MYVCTYVCTDLGVGVDEGVDRVELRESERVEHSAARLRGNPDHPVSGAHRESGGRGHLQSKAMVASFCTTSRHAR